MRHRVAKGGLGLPTDQRIALLRNQLASLLIHEKVNTTEPRAKQLKRLAEKLITKAKTDTVQARREVAKYLPKPPSTPAVLRKKRKGKPLPERQVLKKLFDEIAPRYADRPGGYTRVVKIGPRRGDAAPMAAVMLVE